MSEQTTAKPEYYLDRSGADLDDKCPMAFWLNRYEGGLGLVATDDPIALKIGDVTHQDLAAVAQMEDISAPTIDKIIREILAPLTDDDKKIQKRMELIYRRLGWLAAFALYIEPKIREDYETIHVEDEMVLDRDPLFVAFTPDRLLRKRSTGEIQYREYKTTISASQKWLHSWFFSIQMHISLAGVSEEIKQKVAFAQVMGLMKGNDQGDRLSHPYVWAWWNSTSNEWTHDYTRARSAAWVPMPVWEYPFGLVDWVLKCGSEVALAQFPMSPPIFLNERMLQEWVDRKTRRMRTVGLVEKLAVHDRLTRLTFFERKQLHCRPAFGDPCPYLKACWNAEVEANPSADPAYQKRTPHHEVELMFRR